MARLLKSSTVRRRLFAEADDVTDQAKSDNLTNTLQESIKADVEEKKKKWNFDFENEVPLDGAYQWYPTNTNTRYDWVGVKTETEVSCLTKKRENEYTPIFKEQTQKTPRVSKRKSNTDVETGKGIRRKITFD